MSSKTYIDIVIWVVAGLALGGILYLAAFQPHQPAAGLNATGSQAGNGTNLSGTAAQAKVDITVINPQDCPECRPMGPFVMQLGNVAESLNITVGEVRNLTAAEGAALIAKYNITRLPAAILTGGPFPEAFIYDWESTAGTRESDGALVLREIYPPYYEDGAVVGLVEGIAIMPANCPECPDTGGVFTYLSDEAGVVFSSTTLLNETDAEARALIAKYGITKVPALLLSDDAEAYPPIVEYLLPLGEMKDGWFVLRNVTPPYVDLEANGTVRGLVESILLVNSSCTDCYNVSEMSAYIASGTGFALVSNRTYDVNSTEARAVLKRYNITAIPTVLYSPEASAYAGFTELWEERGNTVESDGWFVFRGLDLIGVTYQNVSG
jgi:hypothetical protein